MKDIREENLVLVPGRVQVFSTAQHKNHCSNKNTKAGAKGKSHLTSVQTLGSWLSKSTAFFTLSLGSI